MSAYCATKFAIRGLTQCAAMDYAKYGITANSYSPGVIETPLCKSIQRIFPPRPSDVHTLYPSGGVG